MKGSVRERAALTAKVEKRALEAMARRMPRTVTSDHLTVLGVAGAGGVAAGYALSTFSPHWLWLASAMLVVNWFGDSLDGTLARVRDAQRPRYGYYLDHAVDAFTTAIIGIGIGLSPYVSLIPASAAVILYLMLSINVYLESSVYGVFRMDYGPVGPTEARILLIVGNTALFAATVGGVDPGRIEPTASLATAVVVLVMALLLLVRFARNLRRLGREDPLERGEAPRTKRRQVVR
ncbi:MAG: CDP-alcohol phosphatidyltransferase family protein [Gemmatimonadota bacterium]